MRRTACALLLLILPSLAFAAPTVEITSPQDGHPATSNQVSGTVSDGPNLHVSVEGHDATITGTDPTDATKKTFQVVLPQGTFVLGEPKTLTATATDDTGTGEAQVTVTVPLLVEFTSPANGADVVTQTTGVQVDGHVSDAAGLPITVFALRGLTTALDANNDFSEFVKIAAGTSTVFAFAQDSDDNTFAAQFDATRVNPVCQDPGNDADFPQPDANDPNAPHVFTVDRSDDLPDANPGDGNCDVRDPAPGSFDPPILHCTLRAALQEANAHRKPDGSGIPDRIFFGVRTIVLRHQGPREDTGARGDLDVTDDLRISGVARDLSIIDGRKLGDRVFDVSAGVKLQLLELTVNGGRTPRPIAGDAPAEATGGCVRSGGILRTNNVAFLGCGASGDGGAIAQSGGSADLTCTIVARSSAKASGGAIAADGGDLTVQNSTLSFNSAGARGGGISRRNGTLLLTNATLSNDRAKTAGGALDLDLGEGAQATVNNCTFAANAARVGSTLAGAAPGEAKISNSILADTSRVDCDPNALPVSGGGNVEREDGCLPSPHATDQTNVDPGLGKLANNGSGPPGFRPLPDSPAVDWAGRETACEPLDSAAANDRSDWPGGANSSLTAEDFPLDPPFCDAGAIELRFTPP